MFERPGYKTRFTDTFDCLEGDLDTQNSVLETESSPRPGLLGDSRSAKGSGRDNRDFVWCFFPGRYLDVFGVEILDNPDLGC